MRRFLSLLIILICIKKQSSPSLLCLYSWARHFEAEWNILCELFLIFHSQNYRSDSLATDSWKKLRNKSCSVIRSPDVPTIHCTQYCTQYTVHNVLCTTCRGHFRGLDILIIIIIIYVIYKNINILIFYFSFQPLLLNLFFLKWLHVHLYVYAYYVSVKCVCMCVICFIILYFFFT